VVLAQGRGSRLGERAISLRRFTLAWARLQTKANWNLGKFSLRLSCFA